MVRRGENVHFHDISFGVFDATGTYSFEGESLADVLRHLGTTEPLGRLAINETIWDTDHRSVTALDIHQSRVSGFDQVKLTRQTDGGSISVANFRDIQAFVKKTP